MHSCASPTKGYLTQSDGGSGQVIGKDAQRR